MFIGILISDHLLPEITYEYVWLHVGRVSISFLFSRSRSILSKTFFDKIQLLDAVCRSPEHCTESQLNQAQLVPLPDRNGQCYSKKMTR